MSARSASTKPSKDQFLAAIKQIENLSSAPHVLRRAMALLGDSNSHVADVVELIKADPALTADIIRGANSAFFAAGERVSSLDRAVEKIGFRESIRLLKISVAHLLSARDLASYGIPDEDFWAESLFHGLFVEALARETGAADPDTAHTAGLLRFIGRLAINQTIGDLGAGLFWSGKESISDWEMAEVGFPQSYAAAVLLRAWQFPEEVCVAIECQTDPDLAPADNWFAGALHFAAQVLPPGSSPELALLTPQVAAETRYAAAHSLNGERIAALLVSTWSAFEAISRGLYD